MKQLTSILFFGLLITMTLAFSTKEYTTKKTDAEVEKIQGMCVFIYSKPTTEYTYLGSVSVPPGGPASANVLVNHLIKKGKKKYPSADGIIFTDEKLHKVDLVQFK